MSVSPEGQARKSYLRYAGVQTVTGQAWESQRKLVGGP
jgi:hypothetical protein